LDLEIWIAIPNSVIRVVFTNLESWHLKHPNPGIWGLQKLVKLRAK